MPHGKWAVPADLTLAQSYPNPFRDQTRIRYALPAAASVHLVVYNVLGEVVRTLVTGNEAPEARR